MMQTAPCRIKARYGQAEDGEHKDKWFIELGIYEISGNKQLFEPFVFGPMDTEEQCKIHMPELAKIAAESMGELLMGKKPTHMIDMKTGDAQPIIFREDMQ